jgi:hypothetical protein
VVRIGRGTRAVVLSASLSSGSFSEGCGCKTFAKCSEKACKKESACENDI